MHLCEYAYFLHLFISIVTENLNLPYYCMIKLSFLSQTIYINARFLTQTITGVQLYARELCRYLKQSPLQRYVLIAPQGTRIPDALSHLDVVYTGKTKGYIWEQVELPAYLKKRGSPPLINFCNTAPLLYKNQLVTIHDLAFMHHPEWFSSQFARVYRFLIPRIVKRSKHIITVSQSIKSQIVSLFRLPESKISVLYNGLQYDILQNPPVLKPKEKLVFAVSSINPRKNLEGIIRAFELAAMDDYKLVISGAKNQVFASSNLPQLSSRIVFAGYLDNQALIEHYQKAEIFISLSFDEGFGIPTLEAAYFGCKLLLSDIPVYRELFEPVAEFAHPNQMAECAEKLKSLTQKQVDNEQHRLKLVNTFNYQHSSTQLVQLIDTIF